MMARNTSIDCNFSKRGDHVVYREKACLTGGAGTQGVFGERKSFKEVETRGKRAKLTFGGQWCSRRKKVLI